MRKRFTARQLLTLATVAFVAGAVGALIAEIIVHGLSWSPHYGDVPTGVGAIGAIIAGVYAALAFRSQGKQLREVQKRQALTDRQQAYQVHAQMRAFAVGVECKLERVYRPRVADPPRWRLSISNRSPGQISSVACRFLTGDQTIDGTPVSRYEVNHSGSKMWPGKKLANKSLDSIEIAPESGVSFTAEFPIGTDSVRFEARFDDEVGSRWQRTDAGALTIVDERGW
jgi:hypothetical protein